MNKYPKLQKKTTKTDKYEFFLLFQNFRMGSEQIVFNIKMRVICFCKLQNFYFHPLCIDGLIQLACFIWNWQRKFGHQSCWRAAIYILGMEVK